MRIGPATRRERAERTRSEFDRFVDRSAEPLLRTAYLLVWDLPEAEDLVQECLLRVARRWPRVRSMEHPHAYARRVLVNLALGGARRRARRRSELQAADAAQVDGRADETAARALGLVDVRCELIGALATLPPRQRAVLVLRYFEDLSEAQVAAALDCSVGTVKSTASRGLDRLRVAIEPDAAETQSTAKE